MIEKTNMKLCRIDFDRVHKME